MRENQIHNNLKKIDTNLAVPFLKKKHGFGLGFALSQNEKYKPNDSCYWQGVTGPSFWIDFVHNVCAVVFIQKTSEDQIQNITEKVLYTSKCLD